MKYRIWAIYQILLESQYGTWTINPIKGHLVLKVDGFFVETLKARFGTVGIKRFWQVGRLKALV